MPLALIAGVLLLGLLSTDAAEAQLAVVDADASAVSITDTDGVRHAGELASLRVLLRDANGALVLANAGAESVADAVGRLSAWADLELCQGVSRRCRAPPIHRSRYRPPSAHLCGSLCPPGSFFQSVTFLIASHTVGAACWLQLSGDLAMQLAAMGWNPRCSDTQVAMQAAADGSVTASYRETVAGSYSIALYYRLSTGRGELLGGASTAVRIVADRVSARGTSFSLPQFDGSEEGSCVPKASCSHSSTLAATAATLRIRRAERSGCAAGWRQQERQSGCSPGRGIDTRTLL